MLGGSDASGEKGKRKLTDLALSDAEIAQRKEAEKKAKKKQKRNQAKLKQKQRNRSHLKEDSRTVNMQPADQQAAFFMHAAFSRLSSIEREEYQLLPKHFEPAAKVLESDATTPPDIGRVAKSIGSFIGDVRETTGAAASPRVICVCAAALRATDVARAFAPVKCGVAKLFAKHFKEAEQAEYLRTSKAKVAVGTPHRLHRLCAAGALRLQALTLLIIDTKPDVKGSTIFDQAPLRDSLVAWYRELLHPLVVSGQVKICFV